MLEISLGSYYFSVQSVDQKQIWIVIIFFKVLTHDLSFCSWSEKCSHTFPGSKEVFCYKFKTFFSRLRHVSMQS